MMPSDYVRCDGEFTEIGEDLDMSNFGVVKGWSIATPNDYIPPDITQELAMLERYAQKGEKYSMLKVGTKVLVHTCKEYGGILTGKVGTISNILYRVEKVGVQFDDIKNPGSANGVFWIPDQCLTPYSPPKALLSADNVKEVFFNNNKTVIAWDSGEKTVVGCGEGDHFDPYAGFCAAVVKHVFGSTGEAKHILKMTSKFQTARRKDKSLKEEDA